MTATTASSKAGDKDHLDWIDQCRMPLEFFGCDIENCVGTVLKNETLTLSPARRHNWVQMHDLFLGSLLAEQLEEDTFSQDSSGSSNHYQQQQRRHHVLRRRRGEPTRSSPVSVVHETSDPNDYLEESVELQKDKGKGLPLGTAICAKGRPAVLEKLRAKMKILAQVVLDGKSASLKRKHATITQETPNVETRSLLEIKMGFLSMQYGILLHWTPQGRVSFCVLRKQCADVFYRQSIPRTLISQQVNSKLTVRVTNVKGLSHWHKWMIRLEHVESMDLPLVYRKSTKTHECDSPLMETLAPDFSLPEKATLQVELWNQRKRKLVDSTSVLLDLPQQQVALGSAQVDLEISFESPYREWLAKQPPKPVRSSRVVVVEEPGTDGWDWMCHLC